MGDRIKVLLADDHLVVRMGIAAIISFEKDLVVIGETDNGIDAVRLARELKPDVIVMDPRYLWRTQRPRCWCSRRSARPRR